jgi:hypothetical protein
MYAISKGQVWVLIVGAVFLWMFFLAEATSYTSGWWGVLGLIIVPLVVVFYIVGWKAHKTKSGENTKLWNPKALKFFKWFMVISIVLSIIATALTYFIEESNFDSYTNSYEKQQLDEYVGVIARLPKHADNARTCVSDKVLSDKETKIASCQKTYDARYAAYKDCKADMPWSSHYDCVTWPGANYEQIDCSEETIVAEIEKEAINSCYVTAYSELMKAKRYEQTVVDDYVVGLAPNKASLSEDNLNQLYLKIPATTLNHDIKKRLDGLLEERGYILP